VQWRSISAQAHSAHARRAAGGLILRKNSPACNADTIGMIANQADVFVGLKVVAREIDEVSRADRQL
jgi:hypothetical protein